MHSYRYAIDLGSDTNIKSTHRLFSKLQEHLANGAPNTSTIPKILGYQIICLGSDKIKCLGSYKIRCLGSDILIIYANLLMIYKYNQKLRSLGLGSATTITYNSHLFPRLEEHLNWKNI